MKERELVLIEASHHRRRAGTRRCWREALRVLLNGLLMYRLLMEKDSVTRVSSLVRDRQTGE